MPSAVALPDRLPLKMVKVRIWRIHCPRPGCRFAASAMTEGRAVQALGTHIVQSHVRVQES